MSSILHVLRSDLRDQRLLLGLWVLALGLLAWGGHLDRQHEPRINLPLAIGMPTMFVFYLTVLSQLMYAHPAIDDHGSWRSRPLSPSGVAAAKLIGISLFIALPLSLAIPTTAWLSGRSAPSFWSTLIGQLGPLLLLFLIGVLAGNSRRFLGAFGILVIVTLLSPMLLVRHRELWLATRDWLHMPGSPLAQTLATVVFFGGFIGLTIAHYRRPDVLRHAAGAVLVLAVALTLRYAI